VSEHGAQQPKKDAFMKIGIIGAGNIGATIAQKLAAMMSNSQIREGRKPFMTLSVISVLSPSARSRQ
jgi:predicted dinucleotide-binding enzyme